MSRERKSVYGNPLLNYIEGQLFIGSRPAHSIMEEFGSPCLVFSKERIRRNAERIISLIKNSIPSGSPFYSVKANYLAPVIETLKPLDIGFEIVGIPELNLLKRHHIEPNRILLGGPWLPSELVVEGLSYGIQSFVVYSILDLIRLHTIAVEMGVSGISVVLRFDGGVFETKMGFSLSGEDVHNLKKICPKLQNIAHWGILSHRRAQVTNPKAYTDNACYLLQVAEALHPNVPITIFNLGGGFPEASVCENSISEFFVSLKSFLDLRLPSHCTVIFEPGRFIVGDSGVCLCTMVNYNSEKSTAFLDIGNNFVPRFMKAPLRFIELCRAPAPRFLSKVDFHGPIPSDQDILAKGYGFCCPESGRQIAIANVGAYSITFSTRFPYPVPNIVFDTAGTYECCQIPQF
jgi:diaminopimelate decarboxylase